MLAALAFALLDDPNGIVHPVDNSPVTITWTPSEPNANWAATVALLHANPELLIAPLVFLVILAIVWRITRKEKPATVPEETERVYTVKTLSMEFQRRAYECDVVSEGGKMFLHFLGPRDSKGERPMLALQKWDPEYIVTSEPASSDVRITMNPHAIDWERPHPSDPLHTLEVQP